MNHHVEALLLAKDMQSELKSLGVLKSESNVATHEIRLFDKLITNVQLRKKTEKLFKNGHHAQAVEEAYKLLDNLVKRRAGIADKTGSNLMKTVFSINAPILRLNACITASERDEQQGYMDIFSGCMMGIRNPRAHESDWEDTEQRALELLVLANHL